MSTHEAYLRNALGKYQYPDISKRDILNAFSSYKDLRPNLDTFVFNNGARKELLCLDGTIPVTYKGNTYNIPVCLWLMETHPYNPPMVFVRPTSTMQIKQGKHVDSNGKIYLPYLHEWKHPSSDLYGLIQILTIVFGEDPPVFSRSSGNQARPPYPPHGAQQPNLPYPASGGGMPMPTISGAGTGYPPSTASGYPPSTSSYSAGSSYPGYPSYNQSQQSSGYPSNQGSGYNYYPGYPSQVANTVQTVNHARKRFASTQQQQPPGLSDEQIRASLLSAVEDKMRRRLKEIFSQAQAEMDALKRTQDDLNKGKASLEDMLTRLEKEQNDVERNITILREKDNEIQELLEKMESQEDIDIDDAVVPTAPLYRQLLNCFSEEQATEDAIYYLTEGLKRQVIDLDVYLKQVRELSRRQFQLRALIQRCRQKAGLPEVNSG